MRLLALKADPGEIAAHEVIVERVAESVGEEEHDLVLGIVDLRGGDIDVDPADLVLLTYEVEYR